MHLPQVTAIFNWRKETNVSGLYSIHLRITLNRVAKYYKIDTPVKVQKDQWSGQEDNWVKQSHPFAFEINNKIREKKNIILELTKRCYNFKKSITFENIMQHLRQRGDKNSFYDFMDAYVKRPPEKLEPNTIKKYSTTLTHLKSFRKELFFSDIDNSFIRDFSRYMQTDLELGGAAARKYMEAFKKVIRHARRENYIDPSQMEFLFDGIKIRVPKARRTFLDITEIKKWKNVKFPAGKEYLARDRDMFLFQIYTGYYYKDLFIFTKDQLQKDEEYGTIILGERDKNGNQTIIPLFKFPYSQNILVKYRSSKDQKTVFDLKYLIEEPTYNRNLKEIATLAGISKKVSNKVARHSNAQLWIRYGAEGAVLSKMMGHTQESTTRNYYDVNLPEIVEGTKRVDFGKLGV